MSHFAEVPQQEEPGLYSPYKKRLRVVGLCVTGVVGRGWFRQFSFAGALSEVKYIASLCILHHYLRITFLFQIIIIIIMNLI